MKRKWKHWAICAAIVAGSGAGAGILEAFDAQSTPEAGSRRSSKCACSGAPVTGAGQIDRSRAAKQWAICAAILAGSLAGASILRNIRSFQRLNLTALNTRFGARGRQPVPDTPEICMFWRTDCAPANRAADQPIPSAQPLSSAMQGQHEA